MEIKRVVILYETDSDGVHGEVWQGGKLITTANGWSGLNCMAQLNAQLVMLSLASDNAADQRIGRNAKSNA